MSREVIRDALAALRGDGLIVTVRGRPSRVADSVGETVVLAAGESAIVVSGTLRVTRADGKAQIYPAGTRILAGS